MKKPPQTPAPPTRFGPTDQFWIVTDATPDSELGDICFATSLRNLELQFRGGMTCDRNPTLLTNRDEAEAEARTRLLAARVATAIAGSPIGADLRDARSVAILDAQGRTMIRIELSPLATSLIAQEGGIPPSPERPTS